MKLVNIILFFIIPLFAIIIVLILFFLGGVSATSIKFSEDMMSINDVLVMDYSNSKHIKIATITLNNSNPLMAINYVFDSPIQTKKIILDDSIYFYSVNKGDYNIEKYYEVSQIPMEPKGMLSFCFNQENGCALIISSGYDCKLILELQLLSENGSKLESINCNPSPILKELSNPYSNKCYSIHIDPKGQRKVDLVLKTQYVNDRPITNAYNKNKDDCENILKTALSDFNEIVMIKPGEYASFEKQIFK